MMLSASEADVLVEVDRYEVAVLTQAPEKGKERKGKVKASIIHVAVRRSSKEGYHGLEILFASIH